MSHRPLVMTIATVIMLLALARTSAEAGSAPIQAVDLEPALVRSTVDRPDDTRGKNQIHVMYVVPSDGVDRLLDTNGTLQDSVLAFENWLVEKTNGRFLRLDTYQRSLDVTFLRLSRSDEEIAALGPFVRDAIEAEIAVAGFASEEKLYAVYYDGTSTFACGGGAWPPTLPGRVAAMYLNGLPDAAVPCSTQAFAGAGEPPTYLEFAMLHEILHTLGFVPTCSPHHWRSGHVSDNPDDLMWAGDGSWVPSGWANVALDAGNDDYFNTKIRGCPDLDRSRFLTRR